MCRIVSVGLYQRRLQELFGFVLGFISRRPQGKPGQLPPNDRLGRPTACSRLGGCSASEQVKDFREVKRGICPDAHLHIKP